MIHTKFDKLQSAVAAAADEAVKAQGGNKSAGVRLRKIMQEVKGLAQDVRLAVNDAKKKPAQPAVTPASSCCLPSTEEG